jgi:hypothetical protein
MGVYWAHHRRGAYALGPKEVISSAATRSIGEERALQTAAPSVSQSRPTRGEHVGFGTGAAEPTSNASAGSTDRLFIGVLWGRAGEFRQLPAYLGPATDFATNQVPNRTPRWFNYVNRRLDELEHYQVVDSENDAYPKPPPVAIREAWRVAYRLLDSATPTPSVVPAEEGGVEFAWHKNGWDLVISVLPGATSVWARNMSVGENWSCPLSERFEEVRNILATLP